MNDLIYRQAAIDALGERPMAWTGGDYELGLRNQYDSDVRALETLPSAQQPTFYGYDIEHLAFVAFIMAKEGVRPEEAVAIFRDTDRLTQIVLNEIKEAQENTFRQALESFDL